MSTQSTQGPWSIRGNRIERITGDAQSGLSFDLICTINEGRVGEHQANARLIAASPELLPALDGLLAVSKHISELHHAGSPISNYSWSNLFQACNETQALLDKTKGRP